MSQYRIQSENTKFYILSENEGPGDWVVTDDGKNSIPEHSILIINPPIQGEVTSATVAGVKGLYVALPKNPVAGNKLIWSEEPYLWEIRRTFLPDGLAVCEFTPAEGEDLYWYDKFGIGKLVQVNDGKDLVAPEQYFRVTAA